MTEQQFNFLANFALSIVIPVIVAMAVALTRLHFHKAIQSTVDYLVVVLIVSIGLIFFPDNMQSLYGEGRYFNVAWFTILTSVLLIFINIYFLEPTFNLYGQYNREIRNQIATKWIWSVSATAAIYAIHVFYIINHGIGLL